MNAAFMCRPPALAMLVSLALLGGCGRDEIKVEFMEGCVQGGISKSMCKCIFGKMEADLRAMQATRQIALGGEAGQRLVQATQACLRD